MGSSLLEQALALPMDERRRLAEDIWTSIDAETPSEALTSEQETLLDERSANYRRNPEAALSWSVVRSRISSST